MSNVYEVNTSPPDLDVIKFLEERLEEAKRGEIQSIAVVMSKSNLYTINGWAGMNKNNMAIIGELEALKQDMINYFIDLRRNPIFYDN